MFSIRKKKNVHSSCGNSYKNSKFPPLVKGLTLMMRKKVKSKKHAFTLIELLIVIAIIAILATIIIVATTNARLNSQTAVAKNTLQTFKKATMLYQNETSKIPNYLAYPSHWCHPGYENGASGTCLGELSPTYLGNFNMTGPYGKCSSYSDSYSLCYNYYVYGRSIMFNTRMNPIDRTGPANITDFPTAGADYCDPATTSTLNYVYCDGYTY